MKSNMKLNFIFYSILYISVLNNELVNKYINFNILGVIVRVTKFRVVAV